MLNKDKVYAWVEKRRKKIVIFTASMLALIILISALAGDGKSPELRAQEAAAGETPTRSEWDGSVYEVRIFLERSLKDPDSLEYISWGMVVFDEGKQSWRVWCQYRAKNSFGGYVIEDKTFYIKHGFVFVGG